MNNTKRITANTVMYNLVNIKQVTFEVTDDCNLQCMYCGFGNMYMGYDERKANYLSFNNIKPIIDYLYNLWNENLSDSSLPITFFSFYGGEPLLNMNFIKQTVDYVKHLDIRRNILFSMTTNAMLLDRYMDYLVENDFHLLVSLDGNKNGDSYRVDKCGNSSFERVVRNVKKLQNDYPIFFANNVNFNSVLSFRSSHSGGYLNWKYSLRQYSQTSVKVMNFVQTNPDFSSKNCILSKQIKSPLIYLINRDLIIIPRLKTH